jgi:uncharacterized protein (TIRG00374 family)
LPPQSRIAAVLKQTGFDTMEFSSRGKMSLIRVLVPKLKIAVTMLLLFFVIRSVEPARLLHDLGNIHAGRLVFIIGLYWLGQLACAQRWRQFAAALGMPGGYKPFMRMYFVCMFLNTGLPSLIGGDAIKGYMVSRSTGKPIRVGLASVFQDRTAGLLTLILYGSAASVVYPMVWHAIPLSWAYAAIWLGAILAIMLVWKGERLYSGFIAPDPNSLMERGLAWLADFHHALATMRLSRVAIAQVTAISFFNSALVLWLYQQIAVSVGQNVGLIGFSALLPLITFVVMMPISLGGLGIREWAYVEGLGLLGIPRSSALVIALTTSAVLILANLAGALFLPTIPKELRSGIPAVPQLQSEARRGRK